MAVDKRMAASKELPSVGRENPEPASSISPSSERGQTFAQLRSLAGPHCFRVVADAEGFPIIPGGIYARTDEGAAVLAGPLGEKVTRMTLFRFLSQCHHIQTQNPNSPSSTSPGHPRKPQTEGETKRTASPDAVQDQREAA